MDEFLGDISLNGKRYRTDFLTWREKDIIDFAPRASVPGGSVVMSDLNLYQPLVQSDWRHGFGFHWYEDASGYLTTSGNVDTRQDGLAMLMTKKTSSDTNNAVKRGIVSYGGSIYSYGIGGVRKFNGTSWSSLSIRFTSQGLFYSNTTAGTTLTITGVLSKNSANRLLVVAVHLKSNVSISSVTYGGVSMGSAYATSGTAPKTVLYKLVAPAVGSGSVVVTLGGASNAVAEAIMFYGVDQSTPLGTASTNSVASGTSSSITYSSATKRKILDVITLDAVTLPVPKAADTLVSQTAKTNMSGSMETADGAASVATGWTWTGATAAEHIAVEVNYSSTEPDVNFLLPAGDYMFICPDNERILKMTPAEVITVAGLDHNASDYKWMVIHNGYIFAGKDASNRIHYDSNEDLSQLQGNNSDPIAIFCGLGNIPTIRGIEYAGQLYVARQDGLWNIGDDHVARRVIDYTNDQASTNFRGMAVLNGYLVYSLRDRVIQWNGARVSDITPNRITDAFPYVTYGRFDNFVVADNFLYMTGRTNETTYVEDLLCYDGIGYHKLMPLVTNGTDTITMVGFDVVNNRIWIHLDATADVTYYYRLQDQSSYPFADFPTSGTNSVISSRLDMGFRRVKKSMASLLVEARNCSATQYLSIYFQLDGDGTWHLWDTIITNGVIELDTPAGFLTREFNYVNIRVDFTTATATSSPILEGYTLRFIMRPDTLLGFNFWIVGANQLQNEMAEDERSSAQIREDLLVVRNSKAPVLLIGLEGDEHWGYLTSFTGQPVFRIPNEGEVPDEIEWRFQINFVEVMGSISG
jgi:hypothetical protein